MNRIILEKQIEDLKNIIREKDIEIGELRQAYWLLNKEYNEAKKGGSFPKIELEEFVNLWKGMPFQGDMYMVSFEKMADLIALIVKGAKR